MATTYVVLGEGEPPEGSAPVHYVVLGQREAANAEKACRLVADEMDDQSLVGGVTLIAIPARNWTSGRNTFKAEARRRLLRS